MTHKSLSSLALVLLVAGQLLPQIDFCIVNVALEVMGRSLHTNKTGLVLIVALYGLSFATFIATGGRLGDRYGRKRIFMLGLIGFCIASAICGLASTLISMLIGRLVQGICAALLMPQILATIHATLEGERHSRAVSLYTAFAGLSFVIGQVLGGWLVSANLFGLSWRIAFFINIPLCLLIVIASFFILPETRTQAKPQMDYPGMTLFALLLLCLLLPITLGKQWPQFYWLLLGLLPTGYALRNVEKQKENGREQPLLPPSLFKTPQLTTGFISEASVTFSYSGYLFVTALCLQSALHFSPMQSGNTFIAMGLLFVIAAIFSKRINQRLGNSYSYLLGASFSFLGFIMTIAAFWLFKSTLTIAELTITTSFVGLGNALMLSAAYRIALSHVSRAHASAASSALITIQQGCFALGTAFAGAIYASILSHGYLLAISAAICAISTLLLLIGGGVFYKMRPTKADHKILQHQILPNSDNSIDSVAS